MKKFIKVLFILIFLGIIGFGIFYYRNECILGIKEIGYRLGLLEIEEDEVYSKEELEKIINSKEESNLENIYKGKIDNYYYNQLSPNAKIIYKVVKDNLEDVKCGVYNLKLPSIIADSLKDGNTQEQLNQDFQDAWDAMKLDMPELYYIDVTHMCLMTKTITKGVKVKHELYIQNQEGYTTLPNEFEDIEDVKRVESDIDLTKSKIIKDAKGNNAAKVLLAHNWIIENLSYDTSTNKKNNNNIYGGLIKKEVVCEGYAKTFKYLLDELDIPCVLVCGTGTDGEGNTEKHAWNYVYLDGNWYAVDTTWDDPIIIGNGTLTDAYKYKYFLKGEGEFNNNHIENGKFTENGIEFEYPELSRSNYLKNK